MGYRNVLNILKGLNELFFTYIFFLHISLRLPQSFYTNPSIYINIMIKQFKFTRINLTIGLLLTLALIILLFYVAVKLLIIFAPIIIAIIIISYIYKKIKKHLKKKAKKKNSNTIDAEFKVK